MLMLYIFDEGEKWYLLDWIIANNMDHPSFTQKRECAMPFRNFKETQMWYERLKKLGYRPHIE